MNKKDFDNCSTIIVGKNASRTGHVLMSHNEDDMNCVVQIHHIPRMSHKEDEVLVFDDADRVIPQVSETLAYTWSEFRSPNGESFADGFMNEYGVAVVSNGCGGSKISETEPVLKGIGAGFQGGQVAALAAEAEGPGDAQSRQGRHRAAGKALG